MELHPAPRRAIASIAVLLVPVSGDAQALVAPGSPSGNVAVAGSRLCYEECRVDPVTRPAIVLVHDGAMGAATWDALWPALCDRFHVLHYDRRGKGRSPTPTAPLSQAADLAALLADRGLRRTRSSGHPPEARSRSTSRSRNPERVEQLVLLGPVLGGMATSAHFQVRERVNLAPLIERGDGEAAAVFQAEDRHTLAPEITQARRTLLSNLRQNPPSLRGTPTDGRFQ